jgi:glycosyltransferase involved in cell wall biosynthesis
MKISVITVTWNCSDTIYDCLNAVSEQSHPNIEHVVIDGASKDGTLTLLEAKREQLSVLLSEPDLGIYDALNKGLSKSTGDVVGFLHADDLYAHADVLAHVAMIFAADPTVCAVYGDLQYVRQKDTTQVVRLWRSGSFTPRKMAWGWMPPHPTLYVRREWYGRIEGFDTSYRISADYHSILQLFSQPDFKSVHLPEVLVKMRLGGASNRSIAALLRKSMEDWHALRRTGVGAFCGVGALVWKNLSKVGQFGWSLYPPSKG